YGRGHASPDPRVKESSEKNKISRPKVHGTRGGCRKRHDRFRLRFRLVASDFPGIVCILDGDRSGAVELTQVVVHEDLARALPGPGVAVVMRSRNLLGRNRR